MKRFLILSLFLLLGACQSTDPDSSGEKEVSKKKKSEKKKNSPQLSDKERKKRATLRSLQVNKKSPSSLFKRLNQGLDLNAPSWFRKQCYPGAFHNNLTGEGGLSGKALYSKLEDKEFLLQAQLRKTIQLKKGALLTPVSLEKKKEAIGKEKSPFAGQNLYILSVFRFGHWLFLGAGTKTKTLRQLFERYDQGKPLLTDDSEIDSPGEKKNGMTQKDKSSSKPKNPQLAQHWTDLGIALAQAGKTDKAIEYFHNALEHDSTSGTTWYNLGNAYRQKKSYRTAIHAYRKAIRHNPRLYPAWYNLGQIFLNQKKYSRARGAFKQALLLKPKWGEAWLGLGRCHFQQKNYTKALKAFNRALAFNSDLPLAEKLRRETLKKLPKRKGQTRK